jgi:hypothetical protein
MSKFITGKKLEDAICNIIWDAEKTLLIVSPYIKLDKYFRKLFDKHKRNPKLHIIVVFGKNENEVHRSLNKDDFDFFKEFPNISIVYVPSLHAKYYGNEEKGVVTSINLYDHSFKNNIEFGIYSEQTLLTQLGKNLDLDAWNTCIDIAEKNDVVFIKRPVYENKKFLVTLAKNYINSEILLDYTDHFYGTKGKYQSKRLNDFEDDLELGFDITKRPEREEFEKEKTKKEKPDYHHRESAQQFGYCIRTGEQIKFNPKQPMTYSAWQIWNEYKNLDFRENYCHKTGKPSYGKTSMRNPILEN